MTIRSERFMKVAVIQLGATDEKESNVRKAIGMVERAAKARANFILLPEVFVFRGDLRKVNRRAEISEKVPGETTAVFSDLAKRLSVDILLGSIYERSRNPSKLYNTSVLIKSNGRIAATYRKMNLFEAIIGQKSVKEADLFLKGKKPTLASVGGFKTGLSICFDLRFSEMYRFYVQKGVEIICVPSAFTRETGRAHWQTLLRARAIENLCYVLAPNQIGKDNRGIRYYGHSMIIDPWGNIVSEASENKEEIIYGTINKEVLKEKRKKIKMR